MPHQNIYPMPVTISSAWAKFDRESGDWMPLIQHLRDSAGVAERYWDRYLCPATRGVVEGWLADNDVPDPKDNAKRLAVFLAGIHDASKISAAFASKVPVLAEQMAKAGFKFGGPLTPREQRNSPHSAISHTAFHQWAENKFPETRRKLDSVAAVIGGHHGMYPTITLLNNNEPGTKGAGRDPIWQAAREETIELIQHEVGLTDKTLHALLAVGLNQPCQVVLTAFVIVCDWIASNADLFPYHGEADPAIRAENGLNQLGLLPPWRPNTPTDNDELFKSRFTLPQDASLRPSQAAAMETARKVSEPSLMILEAPTGEGKTESAFAAAEILAQRFGCGGVVMALPTQATSNAAFTRTLSWLRRSVPADQTMSVNLVHGKAEFNEEFNDIKSFGLRGIYGESADDVVRAHWWLTGRKKSVLADFVVCTIDHVLMAALMSKHVVLRMLGLTGKVVILDEVHAADEYMQVYLDSALRWLGALNVPVIALSATLPPERRSQMLRAYLEGKASAPAEISTACAQAEAATGYPLLTTSDSDIEPISVPPSGRNSRTRVRFLEAEPAEIADHLLESVADGGCVAAILDTVNRAQQVYESLRPHLGADVVLLHSRFITADRLKLERELTKRLNASATERPKRLVVVATQVIEQSLDLDFDYLVSDIAPLDSLIQRIGRLHRHSRPKDARPSRFEDATLTITGMARKPDEAPEFDSGCQRVYGKALLLRSAATLFNHLVNNDVIRSPEDVGALVSQAYNPDLEPPAGWEDEWAKAEGERLEKIAKSEERAGNTCIKPPKQKAKSLVGWLESDAKDLAASVRDIADSLEVVLVQRGADGMVRALPWLDEIGGEPVDYANGIAPKLAKEIAKCVVRIPAWLCRGDLGASLISELEADGIASWQESYWLKGMLPLVVDEDCCRDFRNFTFKYDRSVGLTITEKEKK